MRALKELGLSGLKRITFSFKAVVLTSIISLSVIHAGAHDELLRAIDRGDFDKAEAALAKGVDVNIPFFYQNSFFKSTYLIVAADKYQDNSKIVRLLVKHGANLELENSDGNTALSVASRENIRTLIEVGANVNKANTYGYTPLMRAIYMEDTSLIDVLIGKGASVDAKNAEGCSALALAELKTDAESIKHLKQLGARPVQATDRLHCQISIDISDLQKIQSCLSAGANINARDKSGRTALLLTLLEGKHKEPFNPVQLLLSHKADVNIPDKNGVTALMLVRDENTAKLLIKAGAKTNIQDRNGLTPLMHAMKKDDGRSCAGETLAKILISAGAKVNATDNDRRSVLMHAINGDCFGNWPLLLKAGAKIQLKDKQGRTAISYVLPFEGGADTYDFLISAGIKPSPSDNVLSAVKSSDPLALKLAISKGGNVETGDPGSSGNSLVLAASAFNSDDYENEAKRDVFMILLAAGVNPNSTDEEGNNPLMILLSIRMHFLRSPHREPLTRLLIRKKTDLSHKNKEGKTALQIARDSATDEYAGNDDVINILISAGAK